jgi:hypothetical protein
MAVLACSLVASAVSIPLIPGQCCESMGSHRLTGYGLFGFNPV